MYKGRGLTAIERATIGQLVSWKERNKSEKGNDLRNRDGCNSHKDGNWVTGTGYETVGYDPRNVNCVTHR